MSNSSNSLDDPNLIIRQHQPNELSNAEQRELSQLLEHCVTPAAIAIDALLSIQQFRGWISDQTLAAIARYIKLSSADLDSVATFYNLIFRLPVGKIVLHPCNGMACQLLDSITVEQKISSSLGIIPGQTDSDNQFTLIPLPCLGACDKAPVMIANKQLFTHLNVNNIYGILADLAIQGVAR